jgi:hypothetical protein
MTPTLADVTGLATRTEHLFANKVYMDNFFSCNGLPLIVVVLSDQMEKEHLPIFERHSRLKRGDMETRVKGDLIATAW